MSSGDPAVRDFLLGGATTEALGSNNWVVDGTLTASGKPLLANDPHLGARLPSTWYLAHVSAGDFDVIGATLPGAPAVALGRNRFIAWGATNVAADVEDLYRERLDATGPSPSSAACRSRCRSCPETINVKGAGRCASTCASRGTVRWSPTRSTRTTPTSRQARRPEPLEPLAFRWTALDADDSTVPAFLKVNEARNWTEFTAALRDFVVPSQNFVYADVDGHIGYYAPGRIPIRARGRRLAARGRLDRRGGMDRVDSVRRAAAHLRSAGALHRHRQPPAGAGRLSASARPRMGRSRIARSASPTSFAASVFP